MFLQEECYNLLSHRQYSVAPVFHAALYSKSVGTQTLEEKQTYILYTYDLKIAQFGNTFYDNFLTKGTGNVGTEVECVEDVGCVEDVVAGRRWFRD